MKTTAILAPLLIILAFQTVSAIAQETIIRYDIPGASSPPTGGSSSQLHSSIEYDDSTLAIESFSFEVPLFSFISDYGAYNYIAVLGGASTFPYLSFQSSKIEQDGKNLVIKGTLYYRGTYRPITVEAKREYAKKVFYIDGSFVLNIRDYFMFSSAGAIPQYINMDFQAVFDK